MLAQTAHPTEKAVPRSSTATTASIVMLVIATLWCIAWFLHAWHYWEDDAYIHLEFARSVAQGQGYSFNGHMVNGDTSPLWVILLAASHALVPDWIAAGKLLTAMGAVFALAGAFIFSKRLTDAAEGNESFAAAMVLLLVTNPYFCYWAFSGMEALTAAGVAFWSLYAATTKRPTWPVFLIACFLTGLSPVLRPEMAFFTLLASMVLLRQWFQLPGKALSAAKILGFLVGALLVVTPLAIWAAYAIHHFGHVIPNTNAAKRANPGDSVVLRLLNVYGLGFPLILIEVPALLIFAAVRPAIARAALRWSRIEQTIPLGGLVFAVWTLIAVVFYIADHTYVQTRYIFVTAPGLLFTLLAFNYRLLPRWIYRVSLIVSLVIGIVVSCMTVWPFVRNKGVADLATARLAAYVRNSLPQDAPVATYSIGELAFDSQHPIIDIGGITRPGAIPYLTRGTTAMVHWARSEGARYYIAGDQPEPGAVLIYSDAIPEIGWSLNPRHYSRTGQVRLWKLPDQEASVAPAQP